MERAWLQGLTGCNVTVAIVDDGKTEIIDHTYFDIDSHFPQVLTTSIMICGTAL